MELSVIGAGYGRTGTTSLRLALEKLGFFTCFKPGGSSVGMFLWNRYKDKKPMDWHAILYGFQSTLDFPMCLFYKELAEAFPSTKVILTVRDSEQWCDSVESTLLRSTAWAEHYYAFPEQREYLIDLFSHAFGRVGSDRKSMIAAYERHNAEVQETISRDRLLVYDVKRGWKPLCNFLDVPEPRDPFPHVNSKRDLMSFE